MATAQELVSRSVKLISLPDVYIRAKALIDDPDSALIDVANVISQDPGLTARLLKIVNSPFFGFASKIETVSHAINLLGMQQIHDLVLATSVTRAFAGMDNEVMDMNVFWYNSVYCGVASRLLASSCNVLDSERLFVSGLLRDIGHLIMYQEIPEQTQRAIIKAREEHKVLHRIERALIGFDYAQVGAELMLTWNLPASLQETVRFHTEPSKAENFKLEASIVHIADIVARAIDSPEQPASLRVDPVAWQATGLSTDSVEQIRGQVDKQVTETINLIFADTRISA